MRYVLFCFALTGWVLSIIVHLLSIAQVDVSDKIPFIWILHIGIILIWLPVIIMLKKDKVSLESQRHGTPSFNQFGFLRLIFQNTPKWFIPLAAAGFFYAFINFTYFAGNKPGSTMIENGQYILHNHGKFIKALTEEEYHNLQALELRGFSGHWIAFYGIAIAVLFPAKKEVQ